MNTFILGGLVSISWQNKCVEHNIKVNFLIVHMYLFQFVMEVCPNLCADFMHGFFPCKVELSYVRLFKTLLVLSTRIYFAIVFFKISILDGHFKQLITEVVRSPTSFYNHHQKLQKRLHIEISLLYSLFLYVIMVREEGQYFLNQAEFVLLITVEMKNQKFQCYYQQIYV